MTRILTFVREPLIIALVLIAALLYLAKRCRRASPPADRS
ncbi:hypothetical protein ILFOPFJJ_03539 [Ensifer psoraleae]|nr:hypothetical protein [Sinorhizobium psoraleae]